MHTLVSKVITPVSEKPNAYTGQFYPGTHKFDLEMQSAAFDWLKQQLD